ncbi:sulfurtransferase complex subunit TusB [Neptuniibacter sp. CAU 1671]|uniref:sulfurtransferase complex subunit TusB n=1 Tax=Neptuniibacter sp. CAU 1671 TaxID=3032593 RepID=UPI0023D9F08B|nr:sulfurtransferase complex subunit TusB [Neptuniibacter sp. CAU 1671]MDF2180506.1 sulfurtransferase complex subunit TusB [Neptuniibacter sp. CAU 1671]
MALHLINAQPDALTTYQHCFMALSNEDAILLIEDAVYAATSRVVAQRFTELPAGVRLYVLQPDVEARGLPALLSERFTQVDDAGFVSLCCQHDKVISWS